jgi:hypothetical protein
MGRKCLWAVALLSLLWVSEAPSLAGTVPTPPPGTGTPVTVPAPNPLDYNAVSGSVISSQQFNSNMWKSYNDMNAIAAALNGCGYSTGTGVTSVAATSPIVGSIGACVPGAGTTLTLSLASGVPYSGTYFTASNAFAAYRWPGTGALSGKTMALDDDFTGSVSGIACDAARILDITTPTQLWCLNELGDTGAHTVNAMSHTVPYDLDAPPGDAKAHSENDMLASGTIGASSCNTVPWTFTSPFTGGTTPFVQYSLSTNSPNILTVSNANGTPSNTGSTYILCNSGGSTTYTLYYLASGE